MNDNSATTPNTCVVTQPLSTSGEEKTRDLLEILSELTSVSLITASLDSDSDLRSRFDVTEISRSGTGDMIVVAALRFILNQIRMCVAIRERPEEVVLFYGATSYLLPILWAKALGRTVILEPRADVPLSLRIKWEQQAPNPVAKSLGLSVWALERIGYYVCDAIVTYSPSMAEQLDLGRFQHKLHTNGARYIDTDRFGVTVPYDERKRVVGYVGRIDEEKGVRTMAAVAKQLPDDVTFRFVGDGPLTPWLREELASEITKGTVEITGWVDHETVPQEFNQLRLLVMASEPTEGLPTTILEAMACGTPVYATPVSGVPDVVINGKTGFWMTKSDPGAISEQIVEALNTDLMEMSRSGQSIITDGYTFASAVERYEKIFEDLTQQI